ncbi:hypothetical protein ZWY2020_059721 [Hordeum vulgare]|nr:hypothetical protein ZWY2020_059721 [Hordeum vulgare]
MDDSLGWQKAVEELASNNQQLRAQYREIACWFPSVQMMRNHARGLLKVMTSAEKQRAFPAGFNVPPPTILLWAEHVTDVVLVITAPINSDDDTSDDSDDEVEELVVLSDEVEEEPIVQLLAPVIDAVEADKNLPIDWRSSPRSQISQRLSSSSKRWRKMSARRGRRRGLRRRRLRCGAPSA